MSGRALCVLTVAATLVAASRAQDWRSVHLATFDEVWTTIDTTFYDPAFGGLDWAAVRDELRPRAEAAASADEVRRVIREMLARLKRSHFVLLSPSSTVDALPGPLRVPIDVRVIGAELVITRVTSDAAAAAGLAPGQAIRRIDGRGVADLMTPGEGVSGRARVVDMWRRADRALHSADASAASLRIHRPDGAERIVNVRREPVASEVITLGNLPPLAVRFAVEERRTPAGGRAGVIGFNIWLAQIGDRFAAAVDRFRDADGMVIDLRGNPGGLAAMMSGIAGHFFDDRALLGVMQTRPARLEFRANPQRSTADGRAVVPYAGRVAILVDELTASASETFAAGMQSLGRARIFGAQTMGQALPASTRRLPNGDVLMHAVGDFVTSTGRSVEGDGVLPDEPITVSREALAAGRDPALDAALAWIDRGLLPRLTLVAMLQAPARHALPSAFVGRVRPR
jgi:carboxyl-terminal processing protease